MGELTNFQLNLNFVWTVMAAALVFLMQAGFTMLESGLVRAKNSINVAMKNLVDILIVSIVFVLVGFPMMFGETMNGFLGTGGYFFQGFMSDANEWTWAFLFFQLAFAGTATTIVSGAIAERTTFSSYLVISFAISLFIYPLFGHWAWGNLYITDQDGWLSKMGFIDFAGSTVVHSLGAWVALAGVITIGPRIGKYNEDGTVNKIHSSSITMAALGVFLLWFGWFGFNAGSTTSGDESIAMIALNTQLSAAAAGIAAMFLSWLLNQKPLVEDILNGVLAGLVTITAGCHAVSPLSAMIMGFIGGVIVVLSMRLVDQILKLDDAVGAISVHGVCGAWGTIAAALFAKEEMLNAGGRLEQLGVQALGVGTAFAWAFLIGLLIFKIMKMSMRVRVTPQEEIEGLNVSEHGATIAIVDTISSMKEIAASRGDLTKALPVYIGDDTAQLNSAFNEMVSSLNQLMVAVKEDVITIRNSSAQMLEHVHSIESHMHLQLENTHSTNVSIQNIRDGIDVDNQYNQRVLKTIGESVDSFHIHTQEMDSIKQLSQHVSDWIKQVQGEMNETIHSMDAIKSHIHNLNIFTDEVGDAINLIESVSKQINLLSLNAQIEATRAGESGKGFAVVANEINKLSEQTKSSVKKIRDSIETNLFGLKQGVIQIDQVYVSMDKVFHTMTNEMENIRQILVKIDNVHKETQQFLTTFERIYENSSELEASRQEKMAQLEEISAMSESIAEASKKTFHDLQHITQKTKTLAIITKELEEKVGQFKTSTKHAQSVPVHS
nr:ammonium transporter [Bacillus alveayuensis]